MSCKNFLFLLSALLLSSPSHAQDLPPADSPDASGQAVTGPPDAVPDATAPPRHFTVGIGVKASLLGAGVELATPITHNTNVRVGFNAIGFDHNFHTDGIDYNGKLDFSSFTALLDWFPFSGIFRLSAGLAYNGNQIKADASAAAGTTFTLNHVDYQSSASDPVTGNAKVDFNKLAPMVTLGWGNLVPRQGRFSFSLELGALFQGKPRSAINLRGTAIDSDGNSVNAATDPTLQANLQQERGKLDDDLSFFKIYPVIALGLGYRF